MPKGREEEFKTIRDPSNYKVTVIRKGSKYDDKFNETKKETMKKYGRNISEVKEKIPKLLKDNPRYSTRSLGKRTKAVTDYFGAVTATSKAKVKAEKTQKKKEDNLYGGKANGDYNPKKSK